MPASNTPKKQPEKTGKKIGSLKKRTARNARPILLTLSDRQKRFRLSLSRLKRQSKRAIELLCPQWPAGLVQIEVYFVAPSRIARLHRDFMGDPKPTDVIAFQHGEIFICPAIAERQRKEFGLSLHDEILTYIIHGFLHLCGWDDHSFDEFNRMKKAQEKIFQRVRGLL